RLRERPAARARPGGVVAAELAAERLAARAREERPRRHLIARRIADAGDPEVEHRGEPAVREQEVVVEQVAVEPDGRARPDGPRERGLPFGASRARVDLAPERRDRPLDPRVARRERPAAVAARVARAVARVEPAERDHEAREVARRATRIGDAPAAPALA